MKENRKILMTKKLLSEALIDLLREKTLPKISVIELCNQADIARTTFYKYYNSVPDLLFDIESQILKRLKESLEELTKIERIENTLYAMEQLFNFAKKNHNYLEVLLSNSGNLEFQTKVISLIFEQSFPYIQPTIQEDKEKITYVIYGSIALLQLWMKDNYDMTPREMAMKMYSFSYKILTSTK